MSAEKPTFRALLRQNFNLVHYRPPPKG